MTTLPKCIDNLIKPIWKSKARVQSEAMQYTRDVHLSEDKFDINKTTRNTNHNRTDKMITAVAIAPYANFVGAPIFYAKKGIALGNKLRVNSKLKQPSSLAAREMRSAISENRARKTVGQINARCEGRIARHKLLTDNQLLAKAPIYEIAFTREGGGRKMMVARTNKLSEAEEFMNHANANHFDKIPPHAFEEPEIGWNDELPDYEKAVKNDIKKQFVPEKTETAVQQTEQTASRNSTGNNNPFSNFSGKEIAATTATVGSGAVVLSAAPLMRNK